jgi:tripartite ATP-independent transporter DctP family solute receptor
MLTSITRRQAIVRSGAALSGFGILTRRADAAEFTFKFANNLPVSHPLNARAGEAVARIREESGGRLEVAIFPNNQLGGDTDVLSQVRAGATELFTISGLILSTLVPTTSIYGLGFVMRDYDTAWRAMDGELGNYLRAAVAKAGLHCFTANWDNGYRHFFSGTKPIQHPDDLRGFKIRVPISPMWTSVFKALGASPVGINWSETYSALQTKIVDGLENSLANVEASKIYEVQKYCALVSYMWDNFFVIANKRAFEGLPRNLQEILERNFNAAGMAERKDVAALNVSLQSTLEAKGMVFNKPNPEPFKAALQKAGFYAEWKGRFDPAAWALLEKYTGPLM